VLPSDRHVHSEWSWDAPDGSMERTCERAVELGLRSVAFTDHAEFTPATILSDPARLPYRFRRWVRDGVLAPPPMPLEGYLEGLQRCRERFRDLRILSGVELSEPQWHAGPAASLLRRGQFDVIICGQHTLPHGPGTWIELGEAYLMHDRAEVVRRYLTELLGLVEGWDDFAALAHVDYAMRYWPGGEAPPAEPACFEEEYRAVLRALARSGRALEINTQLPLHADILRWWHQEGGTAVSFGSDAHDPLRLAHGFTEAAALAGAVGFRPGRHRHDFWVRG
jgi:histidinol-phosphatase (PHP family)